MRKKSDSTTMNSRVEDMEKRLQEFEARIRAIDEPVTKIKMEFLAALQELNKGDSRHGNLNSIVLPDNKDENPNLGNHDDKRQGLEECKSSNGRSQSVDVKESITIARCEGLKIKKCI